MTRTAIPNTGVYQDAAGRYWARPWINHRRTWRLLAAVTRKAAIKQAAALATIGIEHKFSEIARLYLDRDCPNKRFEPRPGPFTDAERPRIDNLVAYFGNFTADEITLDKLPAYMAWRIRQGKRTKRTRLRSVDKDTQTLSNVLRFAVMSKLATANHVHHGRPRYQKTTAVRHCRSVAPPDADTIHQVAGKFLETIRSEVFAWLTLHEYLTGCRTAELLELRLDSPAGESGHFQVSRKDPNKGLLHLGQRKKRGIEPYCIVGPEFLEMRRCFLRWHSERFGDKTQWYFPGGDGISRLESTSFAHALPRIARKLGLRHLTPHGLRSYYVTKRRSDGASDVQIAGEIGDKTVALMQTTYGSRPSNWLDGEPLSWLPRHELPAWLVWRPDGEKLIAI